MLRTSALSGGIHTADIKQTVSGIGNLHSIIGEVKDTGRFTAACCYVFMASAYASGKLYL